MVKTKVPQLFATSWLGLSKAETPITADKRLRARLALRPNYLRVAQETSFIRIRYREKSEAIKP